MHISGNGHTMEIEVTYSRDEYPTTLPCHSSDVINILAIFNHGMSIEKTPWQSGDSNLRHRSSVNSLAIQ